MFQIIINLRLVLLEENEIILIGNLHKHVRNETLTCLEDLIK